VLGGEAPDLDQLAERLRVDHVVVDTAAGAGESEGMTARIARLVEEAPFDVYVALLERAPGVSGGQPSHEQYRSLAGLLQRRIDGPGLYVVGSGTGVPQVVSYGLGADPSLLSLSASANDQVLDGALARAGLGTIPLPAVVLAEAHVAEAAALVEEAQGSEEVGVYPPTLTDGEADEIVARHHDLVERSGWKPEVTPYVEVHTASRGLTVLVGSLVGLAVALLAGQTLRGWPRRGRPGAAAAGVGTEALPSPLPDPAAERAVACRELDRLVARLARYAGPVEALVAASAARDAAEQVLDSDDALDVVGAATLARVGLRDLDRATRPDRAAYRPCFFDPRHGEGRDVVAQPYGDGDVEVPACRRCAKAVAGGRTPQALARPGRRGRAQPYFEHDDMWARTGFGALSDTLARDVLKARAGR
jgi:hypothetical protein